MTSRRIAPSYSFRFTTADIRHTYGSPEGGFAHGDFLNAAQMATPDSELKGCSLILGGLIEQGLAILDALPALSGRARLCRAFTLWSLNRSDEAMAALDGFDDAALMPAAEKFRALLKRDNINIFITGAILSVFPEHYSESFIAASYQYNNITVKYVGSQNTQNAYDYSATDPLDAFIDGLPAAEQPDILFALSPQWLLPRDFHKVRVPKVIWCHDSDAFQYRNVDNYALYDVAIGNCSQEHFELSQGTPGLYVAANMLLHPLATPFPEASPNREKKFDIIFTGSALAPFHSEKPRYLFNLAELGTKYTVRVVEGHLPEKDYFALVSHAKFLPVVNRYAGSPSPRWRDALANGSYILYPKGTFYGEIAPGTFPYRAETMVDDIRRHIENFNAHADPAYDLKKVIPEINTRFAIHRQPREESYERLLKYALFFGMVWPRQAASVPRRQRRLVWLTPAVDCGLYGTGHIRNLISHIGAHIGPDDLHDDIDYNNAAHLHAQMVFTFREDKEAKRWAAAADRYFAEGLARFPNSLLLRFNDAHWSFFKPNADPAEAVAKFRGIIGQFDALAFSPHGADVAYPYTLHERDAVFPCYEFADVATSELVLDNTPQLRGKKTIRHDTRCIILSACHGYIGWAELKAERKDAGLAELRKAINIYEHGLPTLRLYFDALLKEFLDSQTTSHAQAAQIADAYFAVANVNPSVLLTHVFAVVPILADNGEKEAAREVIAAWYKLANIVHSLRRDDEQKLAVRMDALWRYNALFPKPLTVRVKAAMKSDAATADLTQLELRMTAAAQRAEAAKTAARKESLLWLRKKITTRELVAAVLAESGYARGHVVYAHIRAGFVHWLNAPADVKILYVRKAARMAMRGEVREALFRIQQWSTFSKWSQGVAMNPCPRRAPVWARLRLLLLRLRAGSHRRPGP